MPVGRAICYGSRPNRHIGTMVRLMLLRLRRCAPRPLIQDHGGPQTHDPCGFQGFDVALDCLPPSQHRTVRAVHQLRRDHAELPHRAHERVVR